MLVLISLVLIFALMTFLSKGELNKLKQPRNALVDVELIVRSLCFQFTVSETVDMKKLAIYNWIRIITLVLFFVIDYKW